MDLRSLTRISLPNDEYVYLLGMAISVFISNNGFIIENIINTDSDYSWYDLIDKESGQLKSPIAKTITKNAGAEIAELFSILFIGAIASFIVLDVHHLKKSKF